MKVRKDISREFAKEICDDLNAYLRDNGVYDLAYVEDCTSYWLILMTDSFDGDWKHDHLRWDYLAKQFFKERYNIDEIDIDHEYTEDTGSDWGPAYHTIAFPVENWASVKSTRKGKKMKKNDDGVRIVVELNSLMTLASYYDEIRVKYGLPDNGNAWNDEAMLYDYIYDVRVTLERLIDQINDMRENGGKRLE